MGFMLVTPRIAMFDRGLPVVVVTARSTRNACWTCGNGRSGGAGMTCRVRVSIRPCPRLVVLCVTGTCCQGKTSRAANKPGWLSLTQKTKSASLSCRYRACLRCVCRQLLSVVENADQAVTENADVESRISGDWDRSLSAR